MKKKTIFYLLTSLIPLFFISCGKNQPTVVSFQEQQRFENETSNNQTARREVLGEHKLPVGNSLLDEKQSLEAPSSKRYWNIKTDIHSTPSLFNGVPTETKGLRVITISGKKILISPTSTQPFYEMLNGHRDIQKVVFNAEEITFDSSLNLPSSDVVINGKKVVFTKSAYLSTRPVDYSVSAEQFQTGLEGGKGGDITLQTSELVIEPRSSVLFDLSGGKGQRGGAGQNGSDGISRNVVKGENIVYYLQVRRECNRETHPVTCFTTKQELGSAKWPTNGTDALPGGSPGKGGNGGTFSTSIFVQPQLIAFTGGDGGELPPTSLGGKAGKPINAAQIINGKQSVRQSHAGKDAIVSHTSRIPGEEGTYLTTAESFSITPELAQLELLYAKDAYKAGYYALAHELFSAIDNDLKMTVMESSERSYFITQKYLSQLTDHADYYGNLSQWVPTLSLNYYLKKLNQDKERIFRTLYLTYWMKNRVHSIDTKYETAKKLASFNRKETESALLDLRHLQEDLPVLKGEIEQLNTHENLFAQEIIDLEQKIKEQAVDELSSSSLLKVIRSIGSLATVIPAGQPVLGSIGTGLLTLSTMAEQDTSITSILSNVPQIYDSLSEERFRESSEHWNKEWGKIKYSSMQGDSSRDYFDYASSVAKFMKPIASEIQRQRETLFTHEVPATALEQKIQTLKMKNPEYVGLVNKVEEIIQMRGQLYQQMQMKQHLYNTLYEKLYTLMDNHVELQRNISNLAAGKDSNLLALLNKMENRAKEDLDYHFYLLKKSFEYRFLKTIPFTYHYSNLYDRFFSIAQQDKQGELTDGEVRSIFTLFDEKIAQYKNSVEREVSQRRTYSDDQFEYELSAQQIRELNKKGRVTITVSQNYPFEEQMQNIRLREINISSIDRVGGAKIELHVRPVGEFFLVQDDSVYVFRHNDRREWIFKQNSADDFVRSIESSDLEDGLLQDLFGESAQLFTLPGAIGQWEVSWSHDLSLKAELQSLILDLHCDYELK